jgi:hypothetical protein
MLRNVVILLFLTVSLLSNRLAAQMSHIGLETGYGEYNMYNISSILEDAMESNYLKPVCVSNFPGYVYFRPYLGIERKHITIGGHYTLMSTGARYSIEDYSGSYRFDALIVGNAFGLYGETPLYKTTFMRFYAGVEGGIVLNKLTLNETFRMDEVYEADELNEETVLESNDFYVKPYFKFEYTPLNNLGVSLSVGHYFDMTDNNMRLADSYFDETNMHVDWFGLRASLGVTFRLQ